MTLLGRLSTIGLAKESTIGTYVAPVRYLSVTQPKPEDLIASLRDESMRQNDAVLQGWYPGPSESTFGYTVPHAYPDILGDHLRAIVGPDTTSGGVTTTLSATTIAGATSITTAASIPAGSTVRIDTGSKVETFISGTPTGVGPYTIPVTTPATGLTYGHTSAVAVQSTTTHTFAQTNVQAARIITYSLTDLNPFEPRGYVGSVLEELALKIDAKGAITLDPKWHGMPSAVQSNPTSAYSQDQPLLGWQWTLNVAGVASTRGITLDYTFKRATEAIHSSDGTQGPREVFPGALEVDFKLKAIFENNTDFTTFLTSTQPAFVATITAPVGSTSTGSVLTLTSSKATYTKAATDRGGQYAVIDIDGSLIYNATDGGLLKPTLTNYVSTAY